MWKKKFHFNLLVAFSKYFILTSQICTNIFALAFTDFSTYDFSFPRQNCLDLSLKIKSF